MRHSTLTILDAPLFLADAGMETSLIFDDGIELPDFASFTLLDDAAGRAALARYYDRYLDVAERLGLGVVLDTATWRANPDWGARLGYSPADLARIAERGVDLVLEARARSTAPVLVSGCVGPRGDGYAPETVMSVAEARSYHAPQVRAFARLATDHVTALTMSYPAEAAGIALAARQVGIPAVISFTVETDGTLVTGETLAAAIEEVDRVTDAYPLFYMVNCAHPTHFADALDPSLPAVRRIRGVRANASTLSHAELDEAEELDGGDPEELAARYAELRALLPGLTVVGGCCGTNHTHVERLGLELVGTPV